MKIFIDDIKQLIDILNIEYGIDLHCLSEDQDEPICEISLEEASLIALTLTEVVNKRLKK